jgi:hypothetical protein
MIEAQERVEVLMPSILKEGVEFEVEGDVL